MGIWYSLPDTLFKLCFLSVMNPPQNLIFAYSKIYLVETCLKNRCRRWPQFTPPLRASSTMCNKAWVFFKVPEAKKQCTDSSCHSRKGMCIYEYKYILWHLVSHRINDVLSSYCIINLYILLLWKSNCPQLGDANNHPQNQPPKTTLQLMEEIRLTSWGW